MVASVRAVGAVDNATPWVPGLPAGWQPDDVCLMVAETASGGTQTFTATGWTHVTGSPVDNVTSDTKLHVLWRRLQAGDTAPTISGAALNHGTFRIIGIMNAEKTGDPWDLISNTTETTSDTSATWPGGTTTVANCLICELLATGSDVASTANLGALTNGAYTGITERIDNWTSTGTGGGIGAVTGFKATAGATGASTATLVNAAGKSLMTIAIKSAPTLSPTGPTKVDEDHPATGTTKSFSAVTGDLFLIEIDCEDGSAAPTVSSTPTHTIGAAVATAGDGTGPGAKTYAYTATTTEGITFTVPITAPVARIGVRQFRNHGGVGAVGSGAGATGFASCSVTSVAAQSAICSHWSDWNVSAETTALLMDDYGAQTVAAMTAGAAFSLQRLEQGNGSTPATTTVGLSAGAMQWAMVAVEVLAATGTNVTFGKPTETDTALALSASETTTFSAPTETDTAQAFGVAKAPVWGKPLEADTAFALAWIKSLTVGRPVEADQAFAVAAAKQVTFGFPVEADVARAVDVSTQIIVTFDKPLETDTAFPLSVSKSHTLGRAVESDIAAALAGSKTASFGRPTESDTAPVLTVSKAITFGRPVETDTAFPLSSSAALIVTFGMPVEADVAFPLSWSKTTVFGRPIEADSAFVVVAGKETVFQQANATELAKALTWSKVVEFSKAFEVDIAFAMTADLVAPPIWFVYFGGVLVPVAQVRVLREGVFKPIAGWEVDDG